MSDSSKDIEKKEKNLDIENRGEWTPEPKSNFIKVVTESFAGFVATFKKFGLFYVTFIMLLFMLFYSFILNPVNVNKVVMMALQREDEIRIESQSKAIQQRLEADKLMNQLMTELIDEYNINRIITLEAHNGSNSIAGVEFLFYSAINEMISTNNRHDEDVYDIEYQSDMFQRQQISNLIGQETYNRLKHSNYLYFSDLENYHRTNYRLIHKMYQIGANSLIIIPFVADNIPQVLLLISSKEKTLPAERIYHSVERYRTQIERYLMSKEY